MDEGLVKLKHFILREMMLRNRNITLNCYKQYRYVPVKVKSIIYSHSEHV